VKKLQLLICGLLMIYLSTAYAQDSTQTERNIQKLMTDLPGRTSLMITGVTWAGFQANLNNADKTLPKTSFNDFGFSPMFLWKLSEKIFFESEIEIKNAGDIENAPAFDLEYAKFSYSVNKYLTIGAGKMLGPFGAYGEKWEPNHIERFANSPLRPDDQFLPDDTHLFWGAVVGLDARGAFPMGNSRMSYAFYISNGPTLHTEAEMGGMIQGENWNDQNNNKEVGGRLGFLPFANSSLEIGISGKFAKVGGLQDTGYLINSLPKSYKNVGSNAFAIDVNYLKTVSAIKSMVGIRGQYTSMSVDNAYYTVPSGFTPALANYAPGDTSLYTFKNSMQSYFVQLSIRPSMLQNKFLKNLEFLFRYNSMTPPKDAAWSPRDANGQGGSFSRVDIGLDYWFSWRTGLRFAYETTSLPDGTNQNLFLVRLATGL